MQLSVEACVDSILLSELVLGFRAPCSQTKLNEALPHVQKPLFSFLVILNKPARAISLQGHFHLELHFFYVYLEIFGRAWPHAHAHTPKAHLN